MMVPTYGEMAAIDRRIRVEVEAELDDGSDPWGRPQKTAGLWWK